MKSTLLWTYRKDIDGLRAIAVLSVIAFHFGYFANGYLGVDIFFVISGFLITSIVYKELIENRFSVVNFYARRIRRIIPLVLFTSLTALLIGLMVMLPDDLENLCQSIIATNFFANNILLLKTTGDYWAIANEYKPLMHTWSLGIEEQFYLLYPLIFLFLNGAKRSFLTPILIFLTILSLLFLLFSSNEATKFYSLQFRFFELSIGGLGSILMGTRGYHTKYKFLFLLLLCLLLCLDLGLNNDLKILLVVATTLGVLINQDNSQYGRLILENWLFVSIGKISFSLYMWHQVVLAYTRYFILDSISWSDSLLIFFVIVCISVFTYFLVEQPFRNRSTINSKVLAVSIVTIYLTITIISFTIYSRAGIIRDVPELGITTSNIKHNEEAKYNSRIDSLERDFKSNNKIKVLVIGNSFARDWANVLLESTYANKIEVSYTRNIEKSTNGDVKISMADYIFFSELNIKDFKLIQRNFDIDTSKVYNVGTKNFGIHNGYFYNQRDKIDYCNLRTKIDTSYFHLNSRLKSQWGNKFIDLIGLVDNGTKTIPIFTDGCEFVSLDCKHFTRAGAKYYAKLLHQSNFELN